MLLLHGIAPVDVAPPEGAAACLGSRVAVVYSERASAPEPERSAVLEFGRTVQELARAGPVLPVRFGTTVPDLRTLAGLVREQETVWSARLRAVAGCSELIVHVERRTPTPDPGLRPTTGRDYLLQRVAAARSVEALRDEVAGVLRRVAREVRTLPGRAPGRERLAVLVPHAVTTVAGTDVRRWAAARPGLEVAVTGPWPPFDFGEDVA